MSRAESVSEPRKAKAPVSPEHLAQARAIAAQMRDTSGKDLVADVPLLEVLKQREAEVEALRGEVARLRAELAREKCHRDDYGLDGLGLAVAA